MFLHGYLLGDFQNQEYRFTILKLQVTEKLEEEVEEDHKQLQSVMRFTQMQKILH